MSPGGVLTDLVVLAADSQMEYALRGLFSRTVSLGIRNFTYKIYVHSGHDSGCYLNAGTFMQKYLSTCRYALVLFDLEGCGAENKARDELEQDVEKSLRKNGWEDRAAAIVFDPELEIWVWSRSPHVARILGWKDASELLWKRLDASGDWPMQLAKPSRPKELMERVLRETGKQRSSSHFKQLAEKVGLKTCADSAFIKLKAVLHTWFSIHEVQSSHTSST